MSDRKKAKVIHVDKLIIHADDVVIVPRGRIRDPWLFPHRADAEIEAIEDVRDGAGRDEGGHDRDEGERRPFSWI
ncbi:hypothetical protein GS3922_05990 [Geobacillus subterraneus]|uniref:Uncharacterized protein n=2 Tax=Geobacillus TaxID=129337 RepID=A0ABM6AAF2_9BACL|nr:MULTISPECIES: hypothetical protein [Geobacillus]AMX83267.1 hypothetical protein GS3922_05990 [Geobacillus subterraneus]KZS25295.1 hypothetical protein A5418_04980 [Geobacillus subterraneus]OXB90256.1 hypothetical protein B9L21_05675 [Geobacillus uzenensis]QIZ66952.1 hypothetical protein HF500_06570 [Geobacillus subterraneus]WPZ19180.1 hypothetical protein UM396_04465 [Geobacillus subterraneus]